MGKTNECIDWGIDCGLEGPWDHPTFMPSKVGEYFLSFLDGYSYGFRLRKAGVTERGSITDAQRNEVDRLWYLMAAPRYRRRW